MNKTQKLTLIRDSGVIAIPPSETVVDALNVAFPTDGRDVVLLEPQ